MKVWTYAITQSNVPNKLSKLNAYFDASELHLRIIQCFHWVTCARVRFHRILWCCWWCCCCRLFVRSHFGSPYLLNGERELVTTIFSHSLTYYHIQSCWMQWLNCVQNIDNGQWMVSEWLRQERLHLWWALAIKSTDNMHRPCMKTSTHIWIHNCFFVLSQYHMIKVHRPYIHMSTANFSLKSPQRARARARTAAAV